MGKASYSFIKFDTSNHPIISRFRDLVCIGLIVSIRIRIHVILIVHSIMLEHVFMNSY